MKDPQDALVSMLCDDNRRMREAGCSLAMAAMQVIRDSDGLHRLALAVSAWADAIAKEGGRPQGLAPRDMEAVSASIDAAITKDKP